MTFQVVGLRIYPIKSCGGIDLQTMAVDDRGPLLDRHWMLVDSTGKFMTQRQEPRLAAIRCAIEDQKLIVHAPGMSRMILAELCDWGVPQKLESVEAERFDVRVWKDELKALRWTQTADRWFSEFLGLQVRLAEADRGLNRIRVKGDPAQKFGVKFADSAPFLLINLASLRALSAELSMNHLDPNRFRANIIIDGDAAWEEDQWKTCRIGDVNFPVLYACDRCVIINIDPEQVESDPAILRGLAKFRKRSELPINFGIRMVHQNFATLRVGDWIS